MSLHKFSRPISPKCFAILSVLLLMWTADGECQDLAVPGNFAVPAKPAANKPQPAQPRYWTTQWALEDVDVGKLTRRLGSIGIDTGLDLEGNVSVKFQVGVPTTSLRDAAAYRFDGVLTSSSLIFDGVQLKNLRTGVVYRDGVATLKNLSSQFIDRESDSKLVGNIQGSGLVELVPRGNVTADVSFKELSLAPVSDILAKFNVAQSAELLPHSGDLSGDVKFKVPLSTAGTIATYQLEGDFSGRGLKLAGLPPANFEAKKVRIEKKVFSVDSFSLTTVPVKGFRDAVRLIGNASIPLAGTGDFEFKIAGDDVPIGMIGDQVVQTTMDGKVDFRLIGKGKIDNPIDNSDWSIQGAIASPGLRIAGMDLGTLEHNVSWTPTEFRIAAKRDAADLPKSFRLRRLRCRYTIDSEVLAINRIDASLFGGQMMGSASIPLATNGIISTELEIEDIRPTVRLTDNGVVGELSTTLSGKINWQVPINAIDKPAAHHGRADLKLADMALGGKSVGGLETSVSTKSGELTLRCNGTLFDGSVSVDTAVVVETSDRWQDVTNRLTKMVLDFDGISLPRLFAVASDVRTDLTGTASGEVTITNFNREDRSEVRFPDADINLELSKVNHRSRLLSRRIRLTGKLRSDIFGIDSMVGDYAGGSVRAKGRVYLVDSSNRLHPRADLRISANRVDIQRGLWFAGDSAENYQGLGSMTATLAGFEESIRVRGSVDGRQLGFYGLSLGVAHSGLVADTDLRIGQWKVRFPSVRSRQGGGQVEGEFSISSGRRGGRGIDLASRWRTRRVDFSKLAKQLGESNSLARGDITGELTLGGKSIQDIDDLSGRFNFQLGQTRGAAIPGLAGVSRFLGPVSLATQTFDVGQVQGLIGGGAVVIDEFWLGSDAALIQADGKVFLRSGRLDMNALIATGDYRDIAINFAELAQQYALQTLIPTSAILDLSELLRDRTLVVRVMGRMDSPIIRLQPVETFREEAARFLLREGQRLILAGITAGAAEGLGSD